jgi:hypothetical protein
MNTKILLNLAVVPMLAGSVLMIALMTNHASAAETSPIFISCDTTPKNLQTITNHRPNQGILIAFSDVTSLDFSDAESDAAVALFNCDCPACINALRQLRLQPVANQGQGHCWSNLQEQASQQQIKEVLKNLDEKEGKI